MKGFEIKINAPFFVTESGYLAFREGRSLDDLLQEAFEHYGLNDGETRIGNIRLNFWFDETSGSIEYKEVSENA